MNIVIKDTRNLFKKPLPKWNKLDYYFLNILFFTFSGSVYGIHKGRQFVNEEFKEVIEKQKKSLSVYLSLFNLSKTTSTTTSTITEFIVPLPYYIGSMSILGICMGVSGFAFGVWSPLLIPYTLLSGFKVRDKKSLRNEGNNDKNIKDDEDNKVYHKNWIIERIIDIIESKK